MTTYNKPVAKIIVMSIFFFSGKCNLQTQGIGRIKIAKSERTLKIAEDFMLVFRSKQWPVVISGFQIFFRGVHMAIANIVSSE